MWNWPNDAYSTTDVVAIDGNSGIVIRFVTEFNVCTFSDTPVVVPNQCNPKAIS